MSLSKLLKFGADVRSEARKVSWPSLKETRTLTIMVFILATLVGLFLLLTDMVIGMGLSALLGY